MHVAIKTDPDPATDCWVTIRDHAGNRVTVRAFDLAREVAAALLAHHHSLYEGFVSHTGAVPRRVIREVAVSLA